MGEVVSPNRRYTCREFEHEVNWKVVSTDSRLETVGIYIQYIYITKIVVLVSEPVRGRSRVTELPCFLCGSSLIGMILCALPIKSCVIITNYHACIAMPT